MSEMLTISQPSQAPDDPSVLGCADSYDVFIMARDLETPVNVLRWSRITWSRLLDEISGATVTVPDRLGGLRCAVELTGGLLPWRYGLRIERNGVEVWSGPIVQVNRPLRSSGDGADYVEVTAADMMAWMRKRIVFDSELFTNQDGGTVFKAMLEQGTIQDNVMGLYCPTFTTGVRMTREFLALDFEYIYDILGELANSAVDWFMRGRDLVVYSLTGAAHTPTGQGWIYINRLGGTDRIQTRTDDDYGRPVLGLFTDEAWRERPGYTVDGWEQANDWFVPGTDSGEAGFRLYWSAFDINVLDGTLTGIDVNPLYRPQEGIPITATGVFQRRADTLLALYKNAPVTITGGALSANAPVTVDELLPGSLWTIDLAEEGLAQLLTVQRLKSVQVEVSVIEGAIVETIRPDLIPLGTDESQAA